MKMVCCRKAQRNGYQSHFPAWKNHKVKKGKTDLVRYISVILKKYGGTHAQVYMSLNGKKYTKLKMTSGKIAKFRGMFRFQCKLRRKVLWLKVRTYKRNKKGRTYSGFSKAAKIRV